MKILKISGRNLASLAGLFSVDFEAEPLASSGLFAISGPTGAGKSTLLDALCLALYDATPRLLKVTGRATSLPDVGTELVTAQDTRNLLRRGTAEGYAEVDFVGSDGAPYRARWSVRRSRKRADGALQPTDMSLLRLPQLQAIGGTKTEVKAAIEQRIGLTFEQFTRAVLLAQNEFSTFLKTEDNDRGELLETLTGSTIYSALSMRAFERAKREQLALQQLNGQLAGQQPLSTEQRAALEADSGAANSVLAGLDERKAGLEQQLRWHHEADRLRRNEALAQQALQTSLEQQQAAAPRHAALARIDAAQPARPLADAARRHDTEARLLAERIASGERDLAQAKQTLATLSETLQLAGAAVRDAQQAQRAAAPQLDQAKALDARLDALRPAYQQARLAKQEAELACAAAAAALREQQERQRQLALQQQASGVWLEQHRAWQPLAAAWPRWDLLFTQAEQTALQAHQATQRLHTLRTAMADGETTQTAAATGLAAAMQSLAALEATRQAAMRTLAGFDADALLRQRQQLARQRDQLITAEKIWHELASSQQRASQLAEQATACAATRHQADAALATALATSAAIDAALAQAERSLAGAELACAGNVEDLRATLQDDTPCPVCGAPEHPYQHENAALHAMLASLRKEVQHCRQAQQANIAAQAGASAQAASSAAQLATLAAERELLAKRSDVLDAAWDQAATTLTAAPAALAGDWFSAQLATTQQALDDVERQAAAQQQASRAKDLAQQAWDAAHADHAAHAQAAAAAATLLAQLTAEHHALDEKRAGLALQLTALLDELDDAFVLADGDADDWKEHWHSAPARFHAARQADGKQYLQQQAGHDERDAQAATIAAQLAAATDLLARAERDFDAARTQFAQADNAGRAMRDERTALWDGQPVQQIELALQARVAAAQEQLQQQQAAVTQAEQTRIRLDEALLQATQRLGAERQAADDATMALANWLAAWQAGAADAAADVEQLQALLAVTETARHDERTAVQALTAAVDKASTVLQERRAQRLLHGAGGPAQAEGEEDHEIDHLAAAAALEQQLALLATERKAAHDGATALQLALAHDDARRHQASAMLEQIGRQELVERRWARMNDLIGSADGKKFRNYAQQFTLDVLLGYANAHLEQLARRYRLERIANSGQPSLGLMVRDQDMGGELRSVHSLSGGESFLLSLALALGLASLSSNRVRVESLFIDEGFGSLDTDTLRVAMDALDGLQAMGRRVGVISHVQEMTERIATKILVQPAAGGSSTVTVV